MKKPIKTPSAPVKALAKGPARVSKYAGGGKVVKTETMPSGAQQYVRGKTRADKMDTIRGVAIAAGKNFPKWSKAVDASIDEGAKAIQENAALQRARNDKKRR